MPGVYIHIPFCKQACSYCNFHFSTSLSKKDAVLKSIVHEIKLQTQFPKGQMISSIYFGGGTPSLLSENDLFFLFEALHTQFRFDENIEITLEANPDDISQKNCLVWKKAGINRLSIGIQSFHDHHLKFMNRAHNAKESLDALSIVQSCGFDNVSCDLIFGIPASNQNEIEADLGIFQKYKIPHISAYALTLEEKTKWHHEVLKGRAPLPDDNTMESQFYFVMDYLHAHGYSQYEISNYALPGKEAVHNSRYWQGDTYLGLGPSAHSFTGKSRRWNVANNSLYLTGIDMGLIPFEEEILSSEDKYNEYVMTGLRTVRGVEKNVLQTDYPEFLDYFLHQVEEWIKSGHILKEKNHWILTRSGKILADKIASELFRV